MTSSGGKVTVLFLPYRTDAALDHRPYATLGLIALNVFIYFSHAMSDWDPSAYILEYGKINPIQWVTSAFLHEDLMHLIGNMIFLWVFGMLVEGKTGALAFLGIYLGIGVTQSALEQVLMLGSEQVGSLGASSILYGLIGMSLIWAPKNEVSFFWWLFFRGGTFSVTVQTTPFFTSGGKWRCSFLLLALASG